VSRDRPKPAKRKHDQDDGESSGDDATSLASGQADETGHTGPVAAHAHAHEHANENAQAHSQEAHKAAINALLAFENKKISTTSICAPVAVRQRRNLMQ